MHDTGLKEEEGWWPDEQSWHAGLRLVIDQLPLSFIDLSLMSSPLTVCVKTCTLPSSNRGRCNQSARECMKPTDTGRCRDQAASSRGCSVPEEATSCNASGSRVRA